MQSLLLHTPVDAIDGDGQTAVHLAARQRHVLVVWALLASDAAVATESVRQMTPLHEAAEGGHNGVAQALFAAGAAVNVETVDRETPLRMAASAGHTRVVQVPVVGSIRAESGEPTPQVTEE